VDYLGGVSVEQWRTNAAARSDETRRSGARVVIPEDGDWPARLDDLGDVAFAAAPSSALCLWARGATFAIPARTVAINGSHHATADRAAVASELGYGLAAAGWTVAATSGRGIAAAALGGALAAGGPVVAVLPGGIDQPTPAGNATLLTRSTRTGCWSAPTRPAPIHRRRTPAGRTRQRHRPGRDRHAHQRRRTRRGCHRGRRALILPAPALAHLTAGPHQAAHHDRRARLVQDTADVLAGLPTLR